MSTVSLKRAGDQREIKQDDVGMSGKHWLLFSPVSRKSLPEIETWWTVKNWKQNNGDTFGKQAAVWVKWGEVGKDEVDRWAG